MCPIQKKNEKQSVRRYNRKASEPKEQGFSLSSYCDSLFISGCKLKGMSVRIGGKTRHGAAQSRGGDAVVDGGDVPRTSSCTSRLTLPVAMGPCSTLPCWAALQSASRTWPAIGQESCMAVRCQLVQCQSDAIFSSSCVLFLVAVRRGSLHVVKEERGGCECRQWPSVR